LLEKVLEDETLLGYLQNETAKEIQKALKK
jgi:hypothetical protein